MFLNDNNPFDSLKEKINDVIQSFMMSCKRNIEHANAFLSLLKNTVDWKEKFESIVDELESIKNANISILEDCKSSARQQADVFQRVCNQFRIILSILNDANSNLEQRHFDSIKRATDRIIESLAQIEKIKAQIDQKIEEKSKLLELHKNLVAFKIESKYEAKKKILDHLKKQRIKYTIGGAAVGAAVGAACGGGVLLAEAFGGVGVCCVAGAFISPIVAIVVPMAIGAALFGGLIYGITKIIESKNKNPDMGEQAEKTFTDFRQSQDSFNKVVDKLSESQNNIAENLNDLKGMIEDEFQRKFHLNSEKISNTIDQFQKMKTLLDEIINFNV